MPKKTIVLLPETEKILEQMGLQIKYARLRRKLTSELVAERAGISRATFDNYVRAGKIPKGEHAIGFKELSWSMKDLDEFKEKYWK